MASSTFLILPVLLLLLHAQYSSVQATEKRLADPDETAAGDGISLLQVNKEISGAVKSEEIGKELRVKGRKMMVKDVIDETKINSSGAANCKHTTRIKPHDPNLKAKMADFTAFSADYHLPKPHPPKHN